MVFLAGQEYIYMHAIALHQNVYINMSKIEKDKSLSNNQANQYYMLAISMLMS